MPSYEDCYVNHAPELLETQARLRRLKLFKSSTGFKEVRATPNFFGRVPREYRDHVSFWFDGDEYYVLSEPYNPTLPIKALDRLVVTILPVEIAPYGGGWSPSPASKPGTRGLLFCLARNKTRLGELERKLDNEAQHLPLWNKVS